MDDFGGTARKWFACSDCREVWDAEGSWYLGAWAPFDIGADVCPFCGAEGDEVEEGFTFDDEDDEDDEATDESLLQAFNTTGQAWPAALGRIDDALFGAYMDAPAEYGPAKATEWAVSKVQQRAKSYIEQRAWIADAVAKFGHCSQ